MHQISIASVASVEYIVPLLTVDRLVLDRVESIPPSFDVPKLVPNSAGKCDVFQLWAWTTRITEYLHLELDGERLEEDHDGDRNAACADVLNCLRRVHGGTLAANLFRVNALEQANPLFVAELGDRPARDVKCVLASDDAHYWSLLQSIYSHGKLKFRKASMFQPTKAFDVWEAMRMLLIQSNMIEGASELYQNVFKHPMFTSLCKFRPKSGSQEKHATASVPNIPDADRERYDNRTAIDAWAREQALQMFRQDNQGQMERVGRPCQLRTERLTVD